MITTTKTPMNTMALTPQDLLTHQIQHYTNRLKTERSKGNTKAVAFLRSELHNLKKSNHAYKD